MLPHEAFIHVRASCLVLAATLAPLASVRSQVHATAVRVAVGFGVDTTTGPNREVFELWRSYLSSRPDSVRPTLLWSRSEQDQWPYFDLLRSYVYQGFSKFTVVDLAPAVGLDSTYLIRTLVASVADSSQDVKPLALYRVYATREQGRWVLANALPRLTRNWNRERIGRITFVFPRTHPFARTRAQRTVAFVDSLASAFEVQAPPAIRYYFADDLRETLRAAGLELFPLGSDTVGGRADVANRLVLIGSPSNGEAYRHEVAHVVLGPFVASLKPAGLVQEGLMTWTGGSAGLEFNDLMPAVKRYLDAHPDVTLESIMTNPPPREGTLDLGYDGFAVLCEMVHRTGGLTAVRALANAGVEPRLVLGTAARILGVTPVELDALWRRRIAVLSR